MRPRIEVATGPADHLMEYVSMVAVAAMIALPIFYWSELPEIVPSHFNFAGEPDDYSGKWVVITLPVIGLIMYLSLRWLNQKPHIFNYPTKITEENAATQYKMATRLVRALNMIITVVFAYLTYTVIQTALGEMSGPGRQFTWFFIILTLGIPLAYLVVASR